MTAYAQVDRNDDTLLQVIGLPDVGGMGPPAPAPQDDRFDYYQVERVDFWRDPPSPTSIRKWRGGDPAWEETLTLDQKKLAAIARTYVDVDAVYAAAVGNRTPEYTEAEAAARVYLAADPKPTVVSEFITDHAQGNPTGEVQTNEWAAQQIVEKADVLKWAVRQMRKVRFARQGDMRTAGTSKELAAAVGEWRDFITWLRATLGL